MCWSDLRLPPKRMLLQLKLVVPIQQSEQPIVKLAEFAFFSHGKLPTFSVDFSEMIPEAIAFGKTSVIVSLIPSRFALHDLRVEIELVLHKIGAKSFVQPSHLLNVVQSQGQLPPRRGENGVIII